MILDEKIAEDLTVLYNSGLKELIEKFNLCKIQKAEDLSLALFGESDKLSSHGLPGYFTGNRGARTVMVMLNPGQDVAGKDNPVTTIETLSKLGINTDSVKEFVYSYKNGNTAFGTHDKRERENETKERTKKSKKAKKAYPDNFDLKQAAFLKEWPEDCDVVIPKSFPPKDNKLDNMDYDEALKTAENVLTQKLQLELVPYASRKFDGVKNDEALFPYVKTLFDEIFSESCKGKEPRYVIFCADFFDGLFKKYNNADVDKYPGWIKYDKPFYHRESMDVFDKRKAYCTPIRIHLKGKEKSPEEGPSLKAIIAHTFPNQSLSNAYDRMAKYGNFCWDTYHKSKI
ncbi:MAG: hypothetical protein IJJ98_13650 [Prevotella sp.]|nr:hypothetical protein [Prevotella sp.]